MNGVNGVNGMNGSGYFEHEKLDVYRVALEVLRGVSGKRGAFAGNAWLYQEGIRSAGSVVLNVAEGASLRAKGAKKRHYQIAHASCGELAAVFDAADAMGVNGLRDLAELNRREGQMLGKLSR